MAKPTKGKSKAAPKPETVEDVAEEVIDAAGVSRDEAAVPPLTQDSPEAEEKVTSEELPENAPEVADADTTSDLPLSEPMTEETVVVPTTTDTQPRKGGFMPLLLGGALAAGVGVVSAQYIFPNGLPFGSQATAQVDLASDLKLQSGRIDDLVKQLETRPQVDMAQVEAAMSAVGDLQGQIGAVVDTIAGLEQRIDTLESRPAGTGSGVSGAVEKEMAELRAALDLQKGTIAAMIEEAQGAKQSAEETARQTLARAAVTRILVALESGAPFEDALADVQANSDITVPESLAQTAASGVPTLSLLGDSYPDAARAALAAVRSEDTGGGVSSFLAKQFGARSVAPREGDDPDAVLSRVEAALHEGRIADALAQADALPDEAKAQLSAWMEQANLRLLAARDAETLANSLNSQ